MTLLTVFGVSLAAFLLVVLGMAVGVMMGRREISGSCGGLANQRDSNGETSCSLCSNPDSACKELKQRMEKGNVDSVKTSELAEDEVEASPSQM